MLLITGGAGFIGAHFIRLWLAHHTEIIVNLDKLTYAAHCNPLEHPHYTLVQGDILDKVLVRQLLQRYQPRAIIHFAAQTHVDRSINNPCDFVQTNVTGTLHLLEEAKQYWLSLPKPQQDAFRFLHISTDEVYGSLALDMPPVTENTPYAPNSPYAASKAASDHIVRAYHQTYGLPTLTTHCSNNYGPYQHREKLIPLMITHALQKKMLPVYGTGHNIRDWLAVTDHCSAIQCVLEKGCIGHTYNIGANNEMTNLTIIHTLCDLLDELSPWIDETGVKHTHRKLITFVSDRLGHDERYAIDASKICTELGWRPTIPFSTGLRDTVSWFLQHTPVEDITA